MATAEQRNHAKCFLKKAEEYLASAEDTSNASATARQPATPFMPGSAPGTRSSPL